MGSEKTVTYHKEEAMTGDILEELDSIRSAAGRSDSTPNSVQLFTIPSNKVFHLTTYGIGKFAAAGRVRINATAGNGLATLIQIMMANSSYQAETGIQGIKIVASTTARAVIRASTTAGSMTVRVGGILRDRIAGDVTTPAT